MKSIQTRNLLTLRQTDRQTDTCR